MSTVATLIADMVRAGVDPDLIGRTAAALAEREPAKVDEQAERRRAADRDRKRSSRLRNSAESADAPLSPSLDKEASPTPPEEIKLSPLTPQAGLTNERETGDLDDLTAKLCEAAGDKIQPHGAIVVGPILELIAQGIDLETDVLPAIRSAAARMTRPASRWSYFVGAIKDAHTQRIEAGKGVSRPKVSAIKRDEDMTPEELRIVWEKRLNFARPRQEWVSWLWGPMPGQPGCRVPPDMLQPRDGKHFDGTPWSDKKQEAA